MRLRGWARVSVLAGTAALCALMPAVAVGKADQTYRLAPAVRISAMTAGPEGKVWFAGYRGSAQPPAPPPGGVLGFVAPDGRRIEYASGGGALGGIAVGSDRALWSTEPATARIIRMTTSGVATSFAVPGAGAELSSIAAGPDGALWFTEGRRDQVGRIATDGKVSEFPLLAGSDARDIVSGSDGALWLAAAGTDSIDRVTVAGTLTSFPIGGGPGNEPRSLTVGPDGNVFFTQRAPRIGRISPDGSLVEFGRPRPANLIAAAGEDLWFTTRTRPYMDSTGPDGGIASITTDGHATGAACPSLASGECLAAPSALAAGPEGAPWFAEGTRTVEGGGASYQLAEEVPIFLGRFAPPPLRVSVAGAVMVSRGKARLDLLCAGGAAGRRCQGRLVLRGDPAHDARLGSVGFHLRNGQARFLDIVLGPKARRLISSGGVSRGRIVSSFPMTGKRWARLETTG
jgi:virginiamycin B lyase